MHAVWDRAYGWAVALSKGVTGVGWALMWPNEEHWALGRSSQQLVWFNVFYNGILAVIGLIRADPDPARMARLRTLAHNPGASVMPALRC